jgi:Domain of unknown function (DUF4169)
MAEIINLRLARKAKGRATAQEAAAANRARHGRTKAERDRLAQEAERAARLIDGAKREPSD